jgi:hypothetical protein
VGFQDGALGRVIDEGSDLAWDVLDEGAVEPGVEGLEALADGEDGLVEVEGVLEEELVDGGAGIVGWGGVGVGGFAVFLGIDVSGGAGQEDALDGGEDFGDALRGFMEGDDDGCGAGGDERVELLRQGALVVGGGVGDGGVGAGFGDGDMDGHGRLWWGLYSETGTRD